jgi:cytochrome c553
MRIGICLTALLLAPAAAIAQPAAGRPAAFLKVCGGCHAVETVTAQRRTRAQWQENIAPAR